MADNDIKTICEKIESLHAKILKSKFAETVTESEMLSLILAVKEINRQKAEIEELRKGFAADMDYFASEYDSKIKAEAIKEFAERLKENVASYEVTTAYAEDEEVEAVEIEVINTLVKEMVGAE